MFKKILIITILILQSTFVFAAQTNVSNRTVVEIISRSVNYTTASYNDVVTVKVTPEQTISGCSSNTFYLLDNEDKAIFSMLLSAQAQNKPVNLYIDFEKKIGNFCKLDAIGLN